MNLVLKEAAKSFTELFPMSVREESVRELLYVLFVVALPVVELEPPLCATQTHLFTVLVI